jgi:integrase
MARLRPEHVQGLYAWLRQERGLTRKTVKALHAVVRQILVCAFDNGAMEDNIVPRIKVPRERTKKREVRALSEEELRRFVEAARTVGHGPEGEPVADRYYALWYLLQATGLRPGEALGLKWEDLDFDLRTLTVHRSLSRVPGCPWELTDPKTDDSARTITLPLGAIPVLREQRRRQAEDRLKVGPDWKGEHNLVFTTCMGRPADWTNLRTHFVRICRRARLGTYEPEREKPKGQPGPRKLPRFIPSFRPYDLRHTHATLLFIKGVSPKVVSQRLGHASVAFTMDVYTAWVRGMDSDAANAVDALLTGAVGD